MPDPGNPIAWNRFAYVYNNPVNYTDPSGHIPFLLVAAYSVVDTAWDIVDVYSDIRDCFGDSDSMACAMLPIDALAVVALFAEGPSNNVARRAAKAADVGDVAGDVARRVDDVVPPSRALVPYDPEFAARQMGGVPEPWRMPGPGEDLYVGTYSKSYYWNRKTGLKATHTPHHVVQDAVGSTTHGKGITINIRKDIHVKTRTYGKLADLGSPRMNLAADIYDLRGLLRAEGYDPRFVNQQLQELIRQNKALGGFAR